MPPVNPELDAIRIAEIEFGKVAVKVLFAAVLVDANHAALEDREIAFGAVDMRLGAVREFARPFLFGVVHGFVAGKAATDTLLLSAACPAICTQIIEDGTS